MSRLLLKSWLMRIFMGMILSVSAYSAEGRPRSLLPLPKVCGEYKISGFFREDPDSLVAGSTNEDSFSKVKLIPWKKEWYKIAGYLNVPVVFQAKIIKIDARTVYFKDVKEISFRVENPLDPRFNQGFVLLRKQSCEAED